MNCLPRVPLSQARLGPLARACWLTPALALAIGWMSPASAVEPLSVQGNQVLVGGEARSLAGTSLFWSNTGWGGEEFYTADEVKRMATDFNVDLVRASIGHAADGGVDQDWQGNMARLDTVIQAAIDEDIYVIVDYHSHHAHEDWGMAKSFFETVAYKWGDYDNVIYEIYNEPLDISWNNDLKPYGESIIDTIRAIDPDNLIVMGTPNWSQDVEVASKNPINRPNIAYTLHFYAGSHGQYLRDKARTALDNGIALFATEWGAVNADGDGDVAYEETQRWMEFLKANHISHANWAWNNKQEGASIWREEGSLTASGQLVKNIVGNWSGTSPGGESFRLEAEDYDTYFDTTAGNSGGAYRNDDVDIEGTSDAGGGYNLGWVAASEYLRYPIELSQSGPYDITLRSATPYDNRGVRVKIDNVDVSGRLEIPNTGHWQNWTDVTFTADLSAGSHQVEVYFEDGLQNLNYLQFTHTGEDGNPGWNLVWSDEFNGNQIDPAKWEHEVNGWGGGNNELQYYTDRAENSYVANGSLVLVAREERFTGEDGTRDYTSARLRTKYKGDWRYGRVEVRARLPEGQGLWPAIWMLPTDDLYGGWAASGEIDIMEAVNLNSGGGNEVHGTLHYGGEWPNNTYSGQAFTPSSSVVHEFHDYAIEWEPGEIRWYVDGIHYQTQTEWWTANGDYPAPFDQRFHLILNVAVGGDWPGSPDASTVFPQTMEVDYVRVYQQ